MTREIAKYIVLRCSVCSQTARLRLDAVEVHRISELRCPLCKTKGHMHIIRVETMKAG